MSTIYKVAKYFITKAHDKGVFINSSKLQKLCYYAQAWSLALNDSRLFENRFQAWVHGPMNPDLYHKYKNLGWNLIPNTTFDESVFSQDELDLLEEVWDVYWRFDTIYLKHLSQSEEPWRLARGDIHDYEHSDETIEEKHMKNYYKSLLKKTVRNRRKK